MPTRIATIFLLLTAVGLLVGCRSRPRTAAPEATSLRVTTYNIKDVRTADLHRANHPRFQRAAARIQHLRP